MRCSRASDSLFLSQLGGRAAHRTAADGRLTLDLFSANATAPLDLSGPHPHDEPASSNWSRPSVPLSPTMRVRLAAMELRSDIEDGNVFVPALLKLAGMNPRSGGISTPQQGVLFCLPFDKCAATTDRRDNTPPDLRPILSQQTLCDRCSCPQPAHAWLR